jgi:hypothetical protein
MVIERASDAQSVACVAWATAIGFHSSDRCHQRSGSMNVCAIPCTAVSHDHSTVCTDRLPIHVCHSRACSFRGSRVVRRCGAVRSSAVRCGAA